MSLNYSLEKKKYEPLEQALKGQSEIVKSRVYNLIVHWGIQPENEFFLIFIAMGQLVALVEEAPDRFDTSFDNFTKGINVWTETNIQILNEIANKAKINERLAGGAEKLAESSTQLVQVCSELIIQLKESNGMVNNSQSQLSTCKDNYEILLKTINQRLQELEVSISNLQELKTHKVVETAPTSLPKSTKQIWNVNFAAFFSLLILFCLLGIPYWRSVTRIDRKTNWLLEKAIRQECLQGIKSAESLECKSLPSR